MSTIREGIAREIDMTSVKLPIKGQRNILITSALPYVNNVPHLGNIIGALLSADVFARYCRARGYNTLYICGTDEYGTATETKALEEKLSCQELCDKYFLLHREIYQWFGISTNYFGRSATPKQTEITHEIFNDMYKNGYFYEDNVSQLYCESCEKFLADRFVEGTCPMCAFPDARGDQCDGCGKLVNATELINPTCKIDKGKPIIKTSHHLFLDLGKIQQPLDAWINASSIKGKWSENAFDITKGWLKMGLHGRCITRDLKWGVPVPPLPEHPNIAGKVFYVWYDACIGYISITANYTDEWRKWWKPADKDEVQLYQFMGKDNVPFHTVIFPGSLLATTDAALDVTRENCSWNLLHHIATTEFLNYEDGKFSKSRGIGVHGSQAAKETNIPPSIWRYYLIATRPEHSDSVFSWADLGAKVNGDLVGNFGNFCSRVLKFIQKNYGSMVPPLSQGSSASSSSSSYKPEQFEEDSCLREQDKSFIRYVNRELASYNADLEHVKLKNALKCAMVISNEANAYLSKSSISTKFMLEEGERCAQILHISVNAIYLLSVLLYPFMPDICESLLKQLNAPMRAIPDVFGYDDIMGGHRIGSPVHLFKRLEEKELEEYKRKFSGCSSKAAAADMMTKPPKKPSPQPKSAKSKEVNSVTEQLNTTLNI